MTKERSAALTALLILVALGWGLVRRGNADRHTHTGDASSSSANASADVDALIDFPSFDNNVGAASTSLLERGRKLRVEHVPEFPTHVLTEGPPVNQKQSTPGKLPRLQKIAPLFPNAADTARLRAAIKQAMPNATASEVRIWEKKLGGMPLHMAKELLDFRRRFPLRDTKSPSKIAPLPPVIVDSPRRMIPQIRSPVVRNPLQQPAAMPEPLKSSYAALHRAKQVVLNNIANARTPGYRRSTVVLKEKAGGGVEVAVVKQESRPGVELEREMQELAKITEHMRAIKTAAEMCDGLEPPRPTRLPITRSRRVKPTAAVKPKRKGRFEVKLNLNARDLIHGVRLPQFIQGLKIKRIGSRDAKAHHE